MKRRDFLKSVVGVIGGVAVLAKADSKPKVAVNPEHPKRVANINLSGIKSLRCKTPFPCTWEERMEKERMFLLAHDIHFTDDLHNNKGFWESKTTGQLYGATDYGLVYDMEFDGEIKAKYFLTEWERITC